MKKIFSFILVISLIISLFACGKNETEISVASIPEGEIPENISSADLGGMDFSFTDRDKENGYDQSEAKEPEKGEERYNITDEGTYILSGDVTDKMVFVNAEDSDKIQIVLDGVNINNSKGPAIYIQSADKVFITANKDTQNYISDGSGYTFTDDEGNEIDGAIFSRADLTINGEGSLTVNGNTKHGVCSKDDLVVSSVNLTVKANNVALNGKDCVKIGNANLDLTSGSDGIRSDNTEDTDRGYVYIESGKININAQNDGVQAETAIKIISGEIAIVAGGGSSGGLSNSEESFKGIKSGSDIVINGGIFDIQSRDDCIHSNNTIMITDGKLNLSSGDDGVHADTDLSISGGEIKVAKSYEGLESSRIFITGGKISVVASDDGLNAAGGNDNSAVGGRPGMGGFSNGIGEIYISGGYIFVDASGDGIDSNGTISVTGGVTLVSGPTNGGNGAFDFDGAAAVTGGVLIATGSSGMAQNFTQAENQGAMLVNMSGATNKNICVCDSDGNLILSFSPEKNYQCAVITAPKIQSGSSYKIIVGAEIESTDEHGYTQDSAYSGGTEAATVEMTSNLYGSGGFGGGMPGGRPGGGKPGRW